MTDPAPVAAPAPTIAASATAASPPVPITAIPMSAAPAPIAKPASNLPKALECSIGSSNLAAAAVMLIRPVQHPLVRWQIAQLKTFNQRIESTTLLRRHAFGTVAGAFAFGAGIGLQVGNLILMGLGCPPSPSIFIRSCRPVDPSARPGSPRMASSPLAWTRAAVPRRRPRSVSSALHASLLAGRSSWCCCY